MRKLGNFLIGLVCMGMLASCSEDADTSDSQMSGSAVKGLVTNGKVEVYQVTEVGQRGDMLASTTTNASGEFDITVSHKGVVEVVVKEGTYVDEASGEKVELGTENELSAMVKAGSASDVAVSALTTIASARAKANADQGLETAIANANSEVAAEFGLSNVDISSIIPADMSKSSSKEADQKQKQYGSVQAGMSQYAKSHGMHAADVLTMVKAMAEDYQDGKFDGHSAEGALTVAIEISPVEAHAGLQTAIDSFLSSSSNKSGVTSSSEVGLQLEASAGTQ